MPSFTELKGVDSLNEPVLDDYLSANLVSFFDWGFINKGGYFNVRAPSSGLYGGNKHRLRRVDEKNYTAGQVWEGYRGNWVWQSGVSQNTQPIQVSGVYVNNVFYPSSSSGTYSHYVDYVNGRIIFNTAIPTGSVVHAEYSYKWINFYDSKNLPWFKTIQYNSTRIDNQHFLQVTSGDWSQIGSTRLQLPAVIIETARGWYEPYQLGGGQYSYNDVIFNILAESEQDVKKIARIISNQKEKVIFLYDLRRIQEDSRYPLDYRGSIGSGALTYPQMVRSIEDGGYRYNKLYFKDAEIEYQQKINDKLSTASVRLTTEVVLTDI